MSREPTYGGGALTALLVVFVTLRLVGVIDWSWWWVLAPLWAPAAVLLVVVLVVVVAGAWSAGTGIGRRR